MTDILHANIFFFVTTIVTIIVAVFVALLLFYTIRLIRSLSRIAEKIESEADEYIEVSGQLRERFIDHPVVKMLAGDMRKPRTSKRDIKK